MTPASTTDATGISTAAERAFDWLDARQRPNGSWEGEVVWCPMITAQYVIVQRILGREIDDRTRRGIIRHFTVTRREGTGWGLHPESHPYVFVTALCYVALRLLGVGPDEELRRARPVSRLRAEPGRIVSIPTWGKFWLSLIGLYAYEGMNPVPPELFLLPRWLPFHPDRLYCHTRYIYLGIAYLYGRRYRVELPETAALRQELYAIPYEQVDFGACRHSLADSDAYVRPSRVLRFAYDAMAAAERFAPKAFRRRALEKCAARIAHEQRVSAQQSISPVNGLLNTLALKDCNHAELDAAVAALEKWRWEDSEEGVRFAGARSQAWDTAFTMQACLEHAPDLERRRDSLRRGYAFLRETQVLSEIPGDRKAARDSPVGGWCFSDGVHRWPVSDCTAEALCAVLAAHRSRNLIPEEERISPASLKLAADFILSRQNCDGGFGTYERRRGGKLLEVVNPSEMFGQCMTELSYTECTASSVKALSQYCEYDPAARSSAVSQAIARGCDLLRSRQLADGSYQGFWGINFTYATFFVTEALKAAGVASSDRALQKAGEWLIARQRPDGGWG